MAFGDPSREDAAADAVPAVGALRIFRGAALVDDHRVALDAAVRVVVADVEGAALSDVVAHVNHGLGGAVVVARPEGEVRIESTICAQEFTRWRLQLRFHSFSS